MGVPDVGNSDMGVPDVGNYARPERHVSESAKNDHIGTREMLSAK
jgi:hypothetical protein